MQYNLVPVFKVKTALDKPKFLKDDDKLLEYNLCKTYVY